MENQTDIKASRFLGKKVSGSDLYDSSLIVAIPREENRLAYNIDAHNLPFEGYDVWHAYEFSAMTNNGLPVTRLLKLKFSCDSEFLVESKSLKLYLNSFNMSKFGNTVDECLSVCGELIKKDLSQNLKTDVELSFLDNFSERFNVFDKFQDIYGLVDTSSLVVDKFKEAPELLRCVETDRIKAYFLTFDSLRSNCRVTHQPDFGDVFVYYKSNKHIPEESLLKYLCSFRSEYHFHEECCEMIYKRLYDLLQVYDNGELFVCALYTRRGGIDICPVRKSHNCVLPENDIIGCVNTFARYGVKQ